VKHNIGKFDPNLQLCDETSRKPSPHFTENFDFGKMRPKNFYDSADTLDVCPCLSKAMISRRLFCVALMLSVATPVFAQGSISDIDEQFTADVLKTMLYAKTAEERHYCDYVIQKRDDGTIPARLFYGAYQKAITKERNQRFLYFKTTLELLCKREGIVLNPTPVRTSASATSPRMPFSLRGLFQRN